MSTSVPPQRAGGNKGPTAIGIVISVSVLSTLFTAARLFVRGKILGKFHLDDYLIVASVLCGWINVGTAIAAVSYGNGRHFDVLTLEQKSGAILWTIAGFAPGVMSFGLPKIAVVALLTRIMNPSRWHALFLWCLSIFCLVNLLGCVIILFAQCQPSHSQWDFSVEKTCWDKWILVYFAIYSGGRYRSVEGSTMIIAACIPVLQPLGELIFGKRMFSSGGGRYTYENYGSGPGGRVRSSIEMSRSRDARKRAAARQRAEAAVFNDATTTTITGKGSQESILGRETSGGKIMRTDVFSIKIEPST
ncbi:integral membrane protein [Colletotrichum higginsianum]|nr:integral membrane protein [Colletotrichum higginsianum]